MVHGVHGPALPSSRMSAPTMASTDTRSGFRLPWSSDRSHDPQPADASADETPEISDGSETVAAGDDNVAWPESDLNARLGLTSEPRPLDPSDAGAAPANATDTPPAAREDPTMLTQEAVTVAPQPAPKKPSKLMFDLSAAIRATAGTAREQALAQVDADVTQVVAAIRTGSTDGADTLRATSDEDISGIKDWSRAEIARIKAETEGRIEARKEQLNAELAAHAAAIDARVAEVEGTAEDYRDEMAAYVRRLETETDPSQLATLAESMPDPPSLEALADLASLAWAVPEPETDPEPEIADDAEAIAVATDAEFVAEPVGLDAADETVAELGSADGTAGDANPETIDPGAGNEPASGWDDPAGATWGEDAQASRTD